MDAILKAISDIWNESGYMKLFTLGSEGSILERIATGGAGNLIMIVIACVLIYLAIRRNSSLCCCRLRSACCWSTFRLGA